MPIRSASRPSALIDLERFHALVDRELAANITSAEVIELNGMRAEIDAADAARIQALRSASAREQSQVDALIARATANMEDLKRASGGQKTKSASRP